MSTEKDVTEILPLLDEISDLTGKAIQVYDTTTGEPYGLAAAPVIALSTGKVDKVAGERLINAAEIVKLANTSNTNTGDETQATIKNKLESVTAARDGYLTKEDFGTFNDKPSKEYVDGLVVGLLDDRGSYDASGNAWPATGGSGTEGAILKGDLWYISVEGTLGGVLAKVGYSIRALVDTPAQTAGNWDMMSVGVGYVPENIANKKSTITNSETDYPNGKAVYDANLLNQKTTDENVYNVTVQVPLSAGQYYTPTTARVAVPLGVRKLGLVITYETASTIWYSERFKGVSVSTWATSGDWDVIQTKADIDNTELTAAETLNILYNRIIALELFLATMIFDTTQIDTLNIVKTLNIFGTTNMILTGTAAPAVIPDFIGQVFVKTSATVAVYTATGITSVNDWKQTA